MSMKDLPPTNSPMFLQRVREALHILMGKGSPEDRALTLGELQDAGIVDVVGSTVTPGSAVGESDDEPDLTVPPTPTGGTVTAAVSTLVIECDEATYTTGHGHDRTIVYGAQYSGTGDLPTFASAVELMQFTGTVAAYSTNPATEWHIWLKWKSLDGVLSAPAGGTNGYAATTGTDVSTLLEALEGELTEDQLATALGDRIDLIDAASGVAGSVNARILTETNARTAAIAAEAAARGTAITNEATLRQAGDDALALQVSLITAGVAGGFDYGDIWYFDSTVEGWTSTGATQAHNAGWVEVTSTGTDPAFISPAGLAISGAQYPVVKARIQRLAGTESSWDGTCFYATGGHGISGSYYKTISVPTPFDVGDTAIVEFAMDDLTAGGTDWVDSTIDQIRLDFGADSTDVISIDWVAIGRNAPGASVAGLVSEQQARISADTAITSDLTVLTARVDTAEADILTEATARADGDSANATLITALDARMDDAEAAITSEATTRATEDAALASSISSVSAVANAKNKTFSQTTAPASGMVTGDLWFDTDDNNKTYRYSGSGWVATDDARIATNAAAITSEATTRASADSSLSSQITTVSAVANAKNKTYRQTTAPASGMTSGDVWFDSDDDNKAYRYDGSTWVATDDARIAANAAAITAEATARADADTALASDITTLTATVDDNTAAIATEATARADADDALTSQITTLSSTVDDNTAAINTEATTRATETGYLGAQYTLRLDVGGVIGGYGVSGTNSGEAGTTIDFGIRANKFYIMPPSGSGDTGSAAFTYLSTDSTVNGVTRPAGLYVTDAFVGNGVITNAKIGELAVDTAKIADAAISTAKIQDAAISTAKIGDATITNAKILDGEITASKIQAGSITTDRLVTNAATVIAESVHATEFTVNWTDLPLVSTVGRTLTNTNVVEITTTGAPLTIWVTFVSTRRVPTTILNINTRLDILIDGTAVTSGGLLQNALSTNPTVPNSGSNRRSDVTLSAIWRDPALPAGTYQIGFEVKTFFITSTSSVSVTSESMDYTVYVVATENKV